MDHSRSKVWPTVLVAGGPLVSGLQQAAGVEKQSMSERFERKSRKRVNCFECFRCRGNCLNWLFARVVSGCGCGSPFDCCYQWAASEGFSDICCVTGAITAVIGALTAISGIFPKNQVSSVVFF